MKSKKSGDLEKYLFIGFIIVLLSVILVDTRFTGYQIAPYQSYDQFGAPQMSSNDWAPYSYGSPQMPDMTPPEMTYGSPQAPNMQAPTGMPPVGMPENVRLNKDGCQGDLVRVSCFKKESSQSFSLYSDFGGKVVCPFGYGGEKEFDLNSMGFNFNSVGSEGDCRSTYESVTWWLCASGPYDPITGKCPGMGIWAFPYEKKILTGAECCMDISGAPNPPNPPICGDGICEILNGENVIICPSDCLNYDGGGIGPTYDWSNQEGQSDNGGTTFTFGTIGEPLPEEGSGWGSDDEETYYGGTVEGHF